MCYPNHNKDGDIISYRMFYSGVDPMTGKHKLYSNTWKVPKNLSKKEIEQERKKAELEFVAECEKKSNGIFIQENNITFAEFANQWAERILFRNNDSYSYYVRAMETLKVLNAHFGSCLLKKISPIIVQKFYDWLCERTHTKEVITVKKSINELVEQKELLKTAVANECGVDRLTFRLANKIGQQVSMTTAKVICKYFDVPVSKYFLIEKQQVKYSKSTNAGIRTILVVILGEAKRQMLIEQNYASREFTRPITMGTSKQKEIFTQAESKEFVQALLKEAHQKKKTVFALMIFMGLRKAEICGLSWSDIDFENNSLTVRNNSLYFVKFGIVTKGTKTEKSNRTIALPDKLLEILSNYKLWYDQQKINYGDLWFNTDRLFLQDNGNPLHPSTINSWLRKFNTTHGFKHIPPHSLRHTCITMQINAGVPLKTVSARAGHANERITLDIYTHSLQSQDTQAADTYNNFLLN